MASNSETLRFCRTTLADELRPWWWTLAYQLDFAWFWLVKVLPEQFNKLQRE